MLSFSFVKITRPGPFDPTHLNFYNNVPLGSSLEHTRDEFYGDLDNDFGRWRKPNASLKKVECSENKEVIYHSNAMGARDIDRLNNSNSKVLALGDSFIEGTLVNESERITDILEQKTNVEHVNFGTIQANPLVEYLTLKSKVNPAVKYDKLLLGILPANDFETNSPKTTDRYKYPIYRPYLDLKTKDIKYTLASYAQSIESFESLKNSTVLRNTRDSLYHSASFVEKLKIEIETNSYVFSLIKRFSINTNVPVDYNLLFDTDTQSDSYGEFKEKLFGNLDELW